MILLTSSEYPERTLQNTASDLDMCPHCRFPIKMTVCLYMYGLNVHARISVGAKMPSALPGSSSTAVFYGRVQLMLHHDCVGNQIKL